MCLGKFPYSLMSVPPGTGTAMALAMSRKMPSHHRRAVGEDEFDNIVTDAAQYGRVQFWDAYFVGEPEPFEWYYGYEYWKAAINESIPDKSKRVMIAGVGSSSMPEDMVSDGYTDIVAQDISRAAIAQLRIRCKHLPEIKFEACNMTDSNLEKGTYFAIIDKALLDSMMCADMGPESVQQYVSEVERLLDPEGGVFIIISHSNPEDMLPLLEQYDVSEPFYTPWYIEVQAVLKQQQFDKEELDADNPDHLYWVYIATIDPRLVKIKRERAEKEKNKKKAVYKKPTMQAPNL